MRPSLRSVATLSTALILAACGGGSPTTAPVVSGKPAVTVAPVATSGPVVTSGPVATTAAGPCVDSTDTTDVATSVGDNTWTQPVTAKVGDVITWTNGDGAPHRVELDDLSCAMSANIPGGGSKSLVFSVAGTFPFHCTVHRSMKGTITIN